MNKAKLFCRSGFLCSVDANNCDFFILIHDISAVYKDYEDGLVYVSSRSDSCYDFHPSISVSDILDCISDYFKEL